MSKPYLSIWLAAAAVGLLMIGINEWVSGDGSFTTAYHVPTVEQSQPATGR